MLEDPEINQDILVSYKTVLLIFSFTCSLLNFL